MTKQPVSLTVRDDRGSVVVRWGEVGVLRSRSFGDAVDPEAWIDAIHFYLAKLIIREGIYLADKRKEYTETGDTFMISMDDISDIILLE